MHPPRPLNISRRLWKRLSKVLHERGRGVSESGAFLLGHKVGSVRHILDFMLYDDIDPNALRGAIVFDGSKMDVVWTRCESTGMSVVADVHTHPGGYGQSSIDQAHPMIPQAGHLALIIPNFSDRVYLPGHVGLYEFLGRDGWRDHSRKGADFLRVSWI